LSINNALEEISAIERLIKPYEYQAYEAKKMLSDLTALRKAITKMDKESIKNAIEKMSALEYEARALSGRGALYSPLSDYAYNYQRDG